MGVLRCGALLVAACAASASAAAQPTVLLVDVGGTGGPEARRTALEQLERGLGRQGGLQVRRHVPQHDSGGDAGIAQLIDEARRLSEQFDEAAALERLRRAEAKLRASPSTFADISSLITLLLTRLKVEADMGRPVRATLERIATLDPSHVLDAGTFVPDLVNRFAAIRERLLGKVVALRIRSEPPGLEIWVDGRSHGNAPVVATVVAGEHFVAAGTASGVGGRRLMVSAPDEVTLRGPTAALQRAARLRAIGVAEGARWVVGIKLQAKGGGVQLQLRAVEAQTVAVTRPLSSAVVPVDGVAEAATALVEPLVEALGLAQRQAGPALWKRWWFWTALGVIAAGGGIAAGVLASRNTVRLELAR